MTLLPVVGRELRVSSRRKETFWTRLGLAFAAITIGALTFFFTTGLPPNQTGRYIFECLACLAFVYCLVQGRRATADSISSEKREGTLGLLFLTDLKGHDIVLGKLTATSLRGFYGLLALFPVLAIPLLLGGVSNGEFRRMVIVLVNTFLFSLAVGIFTSSMSRDFRHAMGANLMVFLLIAAIPPGVGLAMAFFSGKSIIPQLFWSCPAYSFYLCSDKQYGLQASNYWSSTAVCHAVTWLLLGIASGIVPRSWHDQPVRSRKSQWGEFWRAWNYGPVQKQVDCRRQMLNVNAFYWLAGRAIRKPAHVQTFLLCVGLWWIIGWLTSGDVWFDNTIAILTALMLNGALKTWVAIESGQQLADDKKSGSFELLLTVPLKVGEIVQGQLLALKRQFAVPLVLVIGVELLLMRSVAVREGNMKMWLAGMIMLALDLLALIWVAMESALTARSHNHATLKTMTRVLVLPWLVFGLISGFCYVFYGLRTGKEWEPTTTFYVALWFFLGLAADLFFGLTAWRRLTTKFHELALQMRSRLHSVSDGGPESKIAPLSSPTAGSSGTNEIGKQLRAKKPRFKPVMKFAVPGMALLFLITIWLIFIREHDATPAPLLVRIHSTVTPVHLAASSGAALMVLPDGTLWRWGLAGPGFSTIPVPEQIGSSSDWVQAETSGNHSLALRKDGTIWEWGWFNSQRISEPKRVGVESHWTAVSVSSVHSLALKRDGSLWAWGNNTLNQLGTGNFEAFVRRVGGEPNATVDRAQRPFRGSNSNDQIPKALAQTADASVSLGLSNLLPGQVGTNSNWKAVACHPTGSYGIRADGTLWTWGTPLLASPRPNVNLAFPTQVSNETNWTEFVNGSFPMFRTQSGEIWGLFNALPNANSPISACCRLVVSNALPTGTAFASCDTARIFQVRSDGTLWQKPFPGAPGSASSNQSQAWTRVGKRSDWTRLWSSGGTAFGLTAEGTIWTWGYDATRPAKYSLTSYLQDMQTTVRNRLSKTPLAPMRSRKTRPYQKEPRPLIRVVPA